MRYAVISDIHGNYDALNAVLADAAGQEIDRYLFLGDYYRDFERPNEAIHLMRSIPNALVLAGNAEGYLKKFDKEDQSKWTDGQLAALYWNYRNLIPTERAYLDKLPETFSFSDDGVTIHAAHSSRGFLGNVEFDQMDSDFLTDYFERKPFDRNWMLSHFQHILEMDGGAQKRLSALPAGVYLFGHTHVQWHGCVDGKLMLNAGSCGLPLDLELGAPYTILTIQDGSCSVEERRVSYDVKTAIEKLRESDFYRNASVWCELTMMQMAEARGYGMLFLNFMREYVVRVDDRIQPYRAQTWEAGFREFLKEIPKKEEFSEKI